MEDRTTSRLGSMLKLEATWIIVSEGRNERERSFKSTDFNLHYYSFIKRNSLRGLVVLQGLMVDDDSVRPVLVLLNLTYKVLPLGVQVSLIGQAALHDVGAVVGAGFDGGQAATVGAVNQLHQGLRALGAQRHLGMFDRTVSTTKVYIQSPVSSVF